MSIKRLIAIITIYLLACGGWAILGTTTAVRSEGFTDRLAASISQLWGSELVQRQPKLETQTPGAEGALTASHIDATLDLEHRRKGLVWYPTYTSTFTGRYEVTNPTDQESGYVFSINLPDCKATYHDFSLSVDGHVIDLNTDPRKGIRYELTLAANSSANIGLHYRTRGLSSWSYMVGGSEGRVRNFSCTVNTNFADIDFTEGSIAADTINAHEDGTTLTWATDAMITSQPIGVIAPDKINPGPLSTRITFFAPICLGFFFLLLGAVSAVRGISIHPMHFLFVAGGFVAFHLLFAYMVDHVDGAGLHLAFFAAAATSVGLVTSYLRGALGKNLPTFGVTLGQLCFLVLFSYSFFLEGTTGLVVAIGSVIFLGFLMRITATIDWNTYFAPLPHKPVATETATPPEPANEA